MSITRSIPIRNALVSVVVLAMMLTFGATKSAALTEHKGGEVMLSPGQQYYALTVNNMVGMLAVYPGSGQISVCETVSNISAGGWQSSCGINSAGNALNVQSWFGDSLQGNISNNSCCSHTVGWIWYSLTDTLYGGGKLDQGERIRSLDSHFRMDMQSDGNLVVYNDQTGQACWSSGTNGNPGAYVRMQTDGNLVVYSSGGTALWNSQTNGYEGSRVVMQNDGNLVVYQGGTARWASSFVTGKVGC